MRIKGLLLFFGLLVAGLVGAAFLGWARHDRANASLLEALLAASEEEPSRVVRSKDLKRLPPPIRRYLKHVLPSEEADLEAVRIVQHGTFRRERSAAWSPFTATQHVTTRPPGFVWDARIEMVPWIPVRVIDAYLEGRGHLHASLGGILTVADPASDPALDEGELMRYLAEAPLYPTVLLPGRNVEWTPIDDRSARATIVDRGTTASLVFHVNDRNEVERVTGERPFMNEDGTYERRSWNGYWHTYEERAGIRRPVDGEVAWTYPDGEESYWRGHMETFEHRPGRP